MNLYCKSGEIKYKTNDTQIPYVEVEVPISLSCCLTTLYIYTTPKAFDHQANFCQVERRFHGRNLNSQPLHLVLGTSSLSSSSLGELHTQAKRSDHVMVRALTTRKQWSN